MLLQLPQQEIKGPARPEFRIGVHVGSLGRGFKSGLHVRPVMYKFFVIGLVFLKEAYGTLLCRPTT